LPASLPRGSLLKDPAKQFVVVRGHVFINGRRPLGHKSIQPVPYDQFGIKKMVVKYNILVLIGCIEGNPHVSPLTPNPMTTLSRRQPYEGHVFVVPDTPKFAILAPCCDDGEVRTPRAWRRERVP
jgi:hypothetical protein